MRVLQIIDRLKFGGKERQFVELLKGLKNRQNIQCEILLLRDTVDYEEIYDLGLKIHVLSKASTISLPPTLRLFRLCRATKPDIIQAWGFWEARLAIFPAKLLNIKLIHFGVQYARPVKKFSRLWWYEKLTFPFSDLILANSKSGLISHGLKESDRIQYVYNGFDLTRIPPGYTSKIREELNLKTALLIGMVANFVPGKDHSTLIKASEIILNTRSDCTILFIGDGPTQETVQHLISERFKDHFRFLGRRHDIEDIVQAIDIGVLLAKTGHAEGISNAIMEYMALGKPVIATNVGGNPELIVDGETGILIPHEDVDILASTLSFLIDNPELRLSMGKKGQERIKELFSLERMIENFSTIYTKLH